MMNRLGSVSAPELHQCDLGQMPVTSNAFPVMLDLKSCQFSKGFNKADLNGVFCSFFESRSAFLQLDRANEFSVFHTRNGKSQSFKR